MSEKENLSKTAKELGLQQVTAFIESPEKQKQRKKSAAEHKAAQRAREAAKGIKPLSLKVKGDREKEALDQLAKASLDGNFDAVMNQLVTRDPAPTDNPANAPTLEPQSQKSRLAAAFISGVIVGAGVLAALQ